MQTTERFHSKNEIRLILKYSFPPKYLLLCLSSPHKSVWYNIHDIDTWHNPKYLQLVFVVCLRHRVIESKEDGLCTTTILCEGFPSCRYR